MNKKLYFFTSLSLSIIYSFSLLYVLPRLPLPSIEEIDNGMAFVAFVALSFVGTIFLGLLLHLLIYFFYIRKSSIENIDFKIFFTYQKSILYTVLQLFIIICVGWLVFICIREGFPLWNIVMLIITFLSYTFWFLLIVKERLFKE
ncbi:hypothetical protein [Bacillus solimangrovi]|uniref:Uncharacterized protein n=1 Tax=Bacillus solimangrovi TaxID=1305675 RepID=A0A1E5LHV6_9BACI|nr:hypothetical protein [Bacillus solimangrovi]OEH93636.1 hypothetical protein BFG57_01220 [Bacillus solimangrovi]